MIAVLGRVLPTPQIEYAKNKKVTPVNGSWNFAGTNMTSCSTVRKWTTLIIQWQNHEIPADKLTYIKKTLISMMQASGIGVERMEDPLGSMTLPKGGDPSIYNQKLHPPLQYAKKAGIKLLYVILPDKDAVLYSRLKTLADTVYGIHTICGSTVKLLKSNAAYFANVALKFNLKLGGVNHSLSADKLGFISLGKTMVVGIDVTHPSPGSIKGSPSIAGVVASTNGICGQWPASIRAQQGRQEVVEELKEMIQERFETWRKVNKGMLPQKIIVYRDGVSEGQYQTILDLEAVSIDKAISAVYPAKGAKPLVTIVVVGKRHHTRFFPTKLEDVAVQPGGGKYNTENGNPKCGTVVDRGVTSEKIWDFFLQAHHSLKGTARPAHYVVVKDQNKFTPDQMEKVVCWMQSLLILCVISSSSSL